MKKLVVMMFVFAMAFVAMAAQCAATTLMGTQCKRSAQEGGKFCWQHAAMQNLGTCQGKTADGQPCTRKVEGGAKYCWQHAKSAAQAPVKEAKATTKAAKSKAAQTVEKPVNEAKETVVTQCAAKTADGKQCQHKAQPGSKFCWQHAKSAAKTEAAAPVEEAKTEVKKAKTRAAKTVKSTKNEAATSGEEAKTDAKEAKSAVKGAMAGALCAAKTADGSPCKNKAKPGSKFCWRHAK